MENWATDCGWNYGNFNLLSVLSTIPAWNAQESRRTRLRRIKRYGNEDFQSHRRTPMTFEHNAIRDEGYFLLLDNSFRNQLTSYLTCLGGHNVDDFVK
nr:unnamed protein product [Spirometra erinaceieuropaei]